MIHEKRHTWAEKHTHTLSLMTSWGLTLTDTVWPTCRCTTAGPGWSQRKWSPGEDWENCRCCERRLRERELKIFVSVTIKSSDLTRGTQLVESRLLEGTETKCATNVEVAILVLVYNCFTCNIMSRSIVDVGYIGASVNLYICDISL